MNIISGFKDYYDFVVRETDNRKTYIREATALDSSMTAVLYNKVYGTKLSYVNNIIQSNTFTEQDTKYFESAIWFCDRYYKYVMNLETNEYYYAIEQIPKDIYEKSKTTKSRWQHSLSGRKFARYENSVFDSLGPTINDVKGESKEAIKNSSSFFNRNELLNHQVKLNTKIGAPVFINRIQSNKIGTVEVINGILKDIQFNKLFKPEEAYTELYNWIPFIEPIMPNDPTDIQRFEGKGFDKKSSFRHPVNTPKKS